MPDKAQTASVGQRVYSPDAQQYKEGAKYLPGAKGLPQNDHSDHNGRNSGYPAETGGGSHGHTGEHNIAQSRGVQGGTHRQKEQARDDKRIPQG